MKILVLASTYPRWRNDNEPGFVHELCRRLAFDAEVRVVCPHDKGAKDTEDLDGVQVYRFRYAPEFLEKLVYNGGILGNLKKSWFKAFLLPFFFLAQWWAVRKQIRTWKPDVVHAHWIIPQGLVAILSGCGKRGKVPLVLTSHGSDLNSLRGFLFLWIKRLVVSRASTLTVMSRAMLGHAAYVAQGKTPVVVRSMGVDLLEHFVPSQNRVSSTQFFKMLFVGRLVENKGVDILIKALPAILKKIPSAQLEIVGFGPCQAALERLAEQLGVSRSILFEGAVPQIHLPDVYRGSHLFVAPFVNEGLGLVLVEALGCGTPVVVSELATCRDVYDGLGSVVTVPPSDPEGLARGVIEAFGRYEALRHRALVERDLIVRRFDWSIVAAEYREILDKAAG
ncbi:glycosyltransferase [Hahella sp. SMD15-11]|uniref:Glycosyltransferase n=1 Tax=Thermohahella caldifontis TaxID=3142973 RepID=A0AB39V0H0_9GAMM